MSHDDHDVLALLRSSAIEQAPALTLQAEDVMRAARRQRGQYWAIGVGGGVLAVAGALVAMLLLSGSDQTSGPQPAADTTAPSVEYAAHMMPALLKNAVLTPFGDTPNWTMFGISAYDDRRDDGSEVAPLPEDRWADATRWALRGATAHRAIVLTVRTEAGHIDVQRLCTMYVPGTVRSCQTETLPDGRSMRTTWSNGEATIRVGGATVSPARAGEKLYVLTLKVADPESLQTVTVEEAVSAPSYVAAADHLWLPESRLRQVATNPELKLTGVLQPVNETPSG